MVSKSSLLVLHFFTPKTVPKELKVVKVISIARTFNIVQDTLFILFSVVHTK
jgi:hypothetical protein